MIVVVLNIPFALAGALVALWFCGRTINLMTLGGLALAVGILVDEATVEIENIHHKMEGTPSVALAVRRGNLDTAVPRLLAMLCALAVFLPSFFMQGAARALFVPLSMAVGFAMVASYLLSSTFVPVMSACLLRHGRPRERNGHRRRSAFDRTRDSYGRAMRVFVRWRWAAVPAYPAVAALMVFGVGPGLGLEIFPEVDAGRFQLRIKAPTGTRIEETEKVAVAALGEIGEEVGRDKIDISVGYVGVIPSSYPINAIYQWTGVLVGHPGDPDHRIGHAHHSHPTGELAKVPSLRDLQYVQALDYPTVDVEIDRERAGIGGVSVAEVSRSLVAATSSSRFVVPNYWFDPKTGIGYQVQVEIPYQQMDSIARVEMIPIQRPGAEPMLLRDIARVGPGSMPGEYDRYNMKRTVSLTANIAGEDLGRVAGHVDRAILAAGEPPKGASRWTSAARSRR